MAPKVLNEFQSESGQDLAADNDSVQIDEYEPRPETSTGTIEYGFLQIDQYRSQGKCSNKTKRWVALPKGTHVHSHAGSCSSSMPEAQHLRNWRSPCLKRCNSELDLESCETESTISTVATSSDLRRVHFRDGLLPDCCEDSDLDEVPSEHELSAPLAEWIFIDRETCGFSLHEYAPDDAEIKDFASSPYARMFNEELAHVEFLNEYAQQMAVACTETKETYRREERQLDKALLRAGVHVNCLHAAANDIQEASEWTI